MSQTTLQNLRKINQNLGAGLARLEGGPGPALAPTEFEKLRAELLSATACLRNYDANSPADPQLENEISTYRNLVAQLARILPSVSGRLLTEKARLEAARAQVAKTTAWAQASQKTL